MYELFYAFILKIFPEFKIDPTLFDPFLEYVEVNKGDFLFQGYFILNSFLSVLRLNPARR